MTPLLLAIALTAADAGRTPSDVAQQQQQQQQVAAVSSEILVLHGTNGGCGIDPKIGNMPALSKPPFSSYNCYKLLDRTTLPLQKSVAANHKLPTGRDLLVTFKNVITPTKPGDPPRYVISASIQKPDGKSFLPNVEVNAKSGEWFFVGGQEYKGGGLVIGIKVN